MQYREYKKFLADKESTARDFCYRIPRSIHILGGHFMSAKLLDEAEANAPPVHII